MNKYELIYIIDTAVEEAARKELVEKFNGIIAANGGETYRALVEELFFRSDTPSTRKLKSLLAKAG